MEGEEVKDLIEFKISGSAKERGIAELDMKITVAIDLNIGGAEVNGNKYNL